jgi:hypothetical protein
MKTFLPHFAAASVFTLVFSGCGRKPESQAQITHEAESSLPPQEQVVPAQTPVPENKDHDLLKEPSPASQKPIVAANLPGGGGDTSAYEAWFKKYHLDLNDPKMLDADPDGDGFTNREEFLAGTDPLDPNSHPPTVAARASIRLKEYNEVLLPVVLEAVEGNKARLKRTEGGESRVETVKAGDTVPGLPLTVEKVESKQDVDKNGDPVDLSRVTLADSTTKEKVVLMKDLPAKTSASYAVLSSPDGKTSLKVHHGDVFTWPGETGVTYRVVDLSRDQVVLEQVENKKMWTIPRLSEKAPAP